MELIVSQIWIGLEVDKTLEQRIESATSIGQRVLNGDGLGTYDLKPGDAIWFSATTHEVENMGLTAWRAAIAEFKAFERRD